MWETARLIVSGSSCHVDDSERRANARGSRARLSDPSSKIVVDPSNTVDPDLMDRRIPEDRRRFLRYKSVTVMRGSIRSTTRRTDSELLSSGSDAFKANE